MRWGRRGLRLAVASLLLTGAWLAFGLPAVGYMLGMRPCPRLRGRPDLQACRLERVGGMWHCHLEGDPTTLGYANGQLNAAGIGIVEEELFCTLRDLVPCFLVRHLLLGVVSLGNLRLISHLRPAELEEIAGIAAGLVEAGDRHAAAGPAFGRILQYHTLHDVSQYLIDNPLVAAPQVGCTAVALGPSRCRDGRPLVGRLFDFEGGRAFDTEKVVLTVKPDQGLAFVSVAWAGMAGAVTGLNQAGLWASINAAASDGQRFSGRPMILVLREILQHAHGIDEALAILERSWVFVSETVLLASAAEGRAVAVELGPGGLAVRPMEGDALVATNHFLSPRWSGDPVNAARMAQGTSGRRYARATALVDARAPHDPASVLELLRDRRGEDGVDLGFGNRSTINAWIGAHLAVADLGAGIVWVCEPDHGLGRALAFDVSGPRPDLTVLAESPDLALEQLANREWKTLCDQARAAHAAGRLVALETLARRLIALNPRHFLGHFLLGVSSAEPGERRAHLETALALQPAYAADRRAVEEALRRMAPPAR